MPRALAQACCCGTSAPSGYSYTLAPGDYGERATTRSTSSGSTASEGFCEHFAAAFVVVMRALGVPARIVTGYQGAELHAGRRLLHRAPELGARLGRVLAGAASAGCAPTRPRAVAPDRIGRSRRLAPQPGFVAGALGAMSPTLLAQLRGAWEAVNNRWNQWVLNYSRGQQLDLLKSLGFDVAELGRPGAAADRRAQRRWRSPAPPGPGWDRHRVDPWLRQLRRSCASAARARRRRGAARAAARAGRARCASVSAPPASRCADAARRARARSATAAAPRERPDPALTREFTAEARRLRGAAASIIRRRRARAPPSLRRTCLAAAPIASSSSPRCWRWRSRAACRLAAKAREDEAQGRGSSTTARPMPSPTAARRRDALRRRGGRAARARRRLGARTARRRRSFCQRGALHHAAAGGHGEELGRPTAARFVEPVRIRAGVASGAPTSLAGARRGDLRRAARDHRRHRRRRDDLRPADGQLPRHRRAGHAGVRLPEPGARTAAPSSATSSRAVRAVPRAKRIDPLALKGSYAGAHGHAAVHAESFDKYAVDFDGDGHIDLHAQPGRRDRQRRQLPRRVRLAARACRRASTVEPPVDAGRARARCSRPTSCRPSAPSQIRRRAARVLPATPALAHRRPAGADRAAERRRARRATSPARRTST